MEMDKVARDNHAFYYVTIGMVLCEERAKSVVLSSLYNREGTAQLGIECGDRSGYLRVDSSDVVQQCSQGCLAEKIQSGILGKIARQISFGGIKGKLNDEAEAIHDSFKFIFKITEYERDSKHGFEKVEDLLTIPSNEKLGRLVVLKIMMTE